MFPESGPAGSCKFVVSSRLGRWSVRRGDQDTGAFAGLDEAVRFACGLARDESLAGAVGVVVVHGAVHEMHCFTPTQAARPAALHTAPRLRLVEGDS